MSELAQNIVAGVAPTAPVTEAPVTPEAVSPEQDISSARFAHLSKRENELRIRAKAVADAEKRAKDLEDKYTTSLTKFSKDSIMKSPKTFLQENSMSLEDFIKASIAEADGVTLEPDLKDELAEIKKRLSDKEAKEIADKVAADQAAEVAAKATYIKSLTAFITADQDAYELINAYEAYDSVYEVMETYFTEHGKMYSEDPVEHAKWASEQVEDYIFKYIDKGRNAKKFKPKEEPIVEDPNLAEPFKVTEKLVTAPTLTNKTTTATLATPNVAQTDEDRMKAAIALMKAGKK